MLVITTILTIQGYGQNQCDIRDHYEDFISIEKATYNENDYLITRVIETKGKSCFSQVVNNNTVFIDYLLTNFSSNAN